MDHDENGDLLTHGSKQSKESAAQDVQKTKKLSNYDKIGKHALRPINNIAMVNVSYEFGSKVSDLRILNV